MPSPAIINKKKTPALIGPAVSQQFSALLLTILLGIICRHVKLNQRCLRFTIGLFINWELFSVLLVTRIKIHKITPTTGKERGDYVVLEKPQTHELPEESDQFRFLRSLCFTSLKDSVGLIMAKTSGIRISVPLDLSSHPFIPLHRFIRSRRPTPLLVPSLVIFPPRSV